MAILGIHRTALDEKLACAGLGRWIVDAGNVDTVNVLEHQGSLDPLGTAFRVGRG